ncbi:hypothetical protein ACS15_0283 [Ralstonia insidiosa]|uniref:Uncharacterized protein n=2 Tax=Ralstonia insidiosa TaxID=190721 RepID=A0AAC9FRM9_9RALS|nr:hypothetical protein ACS15_0283 [Ralstonia insidiosa]
MLHGTGWQTHISNVIGTGYAVVGGHPVYSHLYFDGLRFIMGGLHRARGAGRTAAFERLPPMSGQLVYKKPYVSRNHGRMNFWRSVLRCPSPTPCLRRVGRTCLGGLPQC